MKPLNWPSVALAAVVILTIAILAALDKDSSALVTSGLAILGALGLLVRQGAEVKEQAVAVKDQTNGNTKQLMAIIAQQQEHIQELAHKLAESTPPPSKSEG